MLISRTCSYVVSLGYVCLSIRICSNSRIICIPRLCSIFRTFNISGRVLEPGPSLDSPLLSEPEPELANGSSRTQNWQKVEVGVRINKSEL